jgi:hypothetical protein
LAQFDFGGRETECVVSERGVWRETILIEFSFSITLPHLKRKERKIK